ncbi:MAG: hypothetical protein ACTHLO_11140 [Pseudolabrys sp.]
MPSESARASSALEAAFRIDAPNARARATRVVALDRPSAAVIARLAQSAWTGAAFLTVPTEAPGRDGAFSVSGWLSDLAGHAKNLADEIAGADQVVMVATAGENAEAASIIGEACSVRRIMTTGLILAGAATPDEALSRTLSHLRPWALMLVVASGEEYIEDMLTALRA